MSSDAARNRAFWDEQSDAYQGRHGDALGATAEAWGPFRVPESELRILGEVAGKDVLELGCGAAQWSIALALRGARPVGLDNSARQLEHARARMAEAGLDFPLVHAPAEQVPLPDASFDVVLADHGAFTFADPLRVVPEAARLLRPAGLLAFAHSSPFEELFWDDEDRLTRTLQRPYFGLRRLEEPDGVVRFNLPHGAWVRLLRSAGLVVERLVENRPPEGGGSTYRDEAETAWARSWPADEIWVARKP